jgi:PAS domain S-box-containing protein
MHGLSRLTLETIVKAIPAAVIIITKENGKICYANDHAIQLYGVDPRNLQNSQHTSNPIKLLTLNGETYPSQELPANKALQTGKKAQAILIIERPDGSQITVSASAMPIMDEEDKIVAAVSIFEDITESRQMHAQLEEYAKSLEKLVEERTKKINESEQNDRELYESFGEAFIATDWELNVIHWNKAAERVTRVKAKDALGKKIYSVLPEMASVDITQYLEALQEKKPVRFMMNTVSRETGHNATFEISTYPSTLGIIIIVEDKTEEESNKRLSAIGQTAGMVGHDIRNPLQAITCDLYLLRKAVNTLPKTDCRQEMHESIESIEENILYINKIVSDLQDYTRPLLPVFEEVNLLELAENVLVNANNSGLIKTEIRIEKDLRISSDLAFLRRSLSNLVSNAVQAMHNGGKLTVEVAAKDGKVIITVEDTGVGISDKVKPKLFTPLFTTKSKGQGLGLAVVKRLVEAQGGTIDFESVEGKGTKFTIQLPLVKQLS